MRGKVLLVFLLLVLLLASSSLALPGVRVARAQGVSYYGPPLQGSELGQLSPNAVVSISILLPPRNLNELMLVAQEVSEHQLSPLSRSQVLNLFAPSQEEFDTIVSFLKESGFTITYLSPDRLSVMAQAPAYVVEKVFGVQLDLYRSPDGAVYYAPSGMPRIPGALQGTLVLGLTNRTAFKPQFIVAGRIEHYTFMPANFSGLPALPQQVASAYTYYTPADFEGAYNVTDLMQYSEGASIAIIDAYGDPLIYQDLAEFDAMFNLPPVNLTIIPIGPYHPSLGLLTGWDIETALDVEAAQSMAPYAHIYLIIAANPDNALFEAVDYVVSTDLADVVSMSWGLPENLIAMSGAYTTVPAFTLNYPFADYYFALGAAEGISFFASSGDEGAFDATPTTYGAVLFPSSSPFVTAVGGTTLFVNVTSGSIQFLNSTGTYGYETAWSVSPLYGTSEVASTGGYSSLFPKPWYQYGVVKGFFRTTPDVAADANPYTGFFEIVDGQMLVIGGTSLASPLWAGITADIDGYLGVKLGLLNPLLYNIYRNQTLYNMAFHQITFGYNGKYLAKPGYNLVTGLGSPNAGLLAYAIKYELTRFPSLSIAVTTYQPGAMYAWYMYNSTFQVVAAIWYPNGTPVTQGKFNAYVFTTQGLAMEVPLTFNGTYWVGNVTVEEGLPPNVWTIVVNGTSAGLSGTGATDVYIGTGLTIIAPTPYPYALSIPVNEPFEIEVYAIYPNGTPMTVPSLTAAFYHDGINYFNATLLAVNTTTEPGLYEGTAMLPYPDPQGAYIMYVYSTAPNGNVDGAAYEYVYFGEMVLLGYVITPLNDGTPSVTAGQSLTFLAQVIDPFGFGQFTSQVYVDIYSLNGTLVKQVPLQPAPAPLLGYQIGYFVVPPSMPPGWYDAVFVSEENSSTGPLFGYLNQSFYVAPQQLSATVQSAYYTIEGLWLNVFANITYANGTPVTQGTFIATAIPAQYAPYLMLYGFSVGVPLQYNASLGEWVGKFYIPSVYTSSMTAFGPQGLYSLAGPWYVFVSGEDAAANNLYPVQFPTYVSPQAVPDPVGQALMRYAAIHGAYEISALSSEASGVLSGSHTSPAALTTVPIGSQALASPALTAPTGAQALLPQAQEYTAELGSVEQANAQARASAPPSIIYVALLAAVAFASALAGAQVGKRL